MVICIFGVAMVEASGDPDFNAQDLTELYGKIVAASMLESSEQWKRPMEIPANIRFADNKEGNREEICLRFA